MQLGFYIAGVAGQMSQHKLDSISHNLANVNTVGYVADRSSFSTIFPKQVAKMGNTAQASAYLDYSNQFLDTSKGNIKQTGDDLDFAINGDAWFRIKTGENQEAYTRAGNFRMGADGSLLTQGGKPVLDTGGAPIQLPPGRIVATDQGELLVNGEKTAALGMVKFINDSKIERIGNSLISTPASSATPAENDISVHQGELEGSNVNSVIATTELVNTMRSFQGMMKIVEQYNHLSTLLSEQVGRVQG